jgi:RNA polymerase sigma-70 factor (ECF subfamily)
MPIDKADMFDQLYRENQPKVYHLALAMTANTHDAEDITQEAFFRAFRSYDSFRQASPFSPGSTALH